MKKLLIIMLAVCMVFAFAACGSSGEDAPENGEENAVDISAMTTADIMAAILADVENLPAYVDIPVDSEIFSYYTFVDYIEGAEVSVSESMNTSIAHSVVLVRVPEGGDAQVLADEMAANADPRKWICVEAEKVITDSIGDVAFLVMSSADTAEAIAANFAALAQ